MVETVPPVKTQTASTAGSSDNRLLVYGISMLVISLGIVSAVVYLSWQPIVQFPLQSLGIVGISAMAAALRFKTVTIRISLSTSLSPLVLSILFLSEPYTWTVYVLWLVGAILGLSWSQDRVAEIGPSALVVAGSGAVLVLIRVWAARAPVSLPITEVTFEAVCVFISVICAFALAAILGCLLMGLQTGRTLGQVALGISWMRIVGLGLIEAVLATSASVLLNQADRVVIPGITLTGFGASSALALTLVSLTYAIVMPARISKYQRRLGALFKTLSGMPWPPTSSVQEQTEEHLRSGLSGFKVSTERAPRHLPQRRSDGRQAISRPISAPEGTFVAVVRRGAFARPFTSDDMKYLDAITSLARESIRTEQEVVRLRNLENTDAMTGLANYRALRSRLVELSENQIPGQLTALIFLNVMDLSEINRRYSPETGDTVLGTIGGRLETISQTRPGVEAFRVAGDEFAVLATQFPSKRNAERLAWEIDENVSEPVRTADGLVAVSIAQTITFAGATGEEEVTALIARADEQMYRARRKFVNMAIESSDDISGAESEESKLAEAGHPGPTAALVEAVRKDLLRQVYTPVINRDESKIVALEVSVRYTDPVEGDLPEAFIRAESDRLGLRSKVAAQILQHAIADMARFRNVTPELFKLFLTVTPAQLIDREFTTVYEKVRRENPELEIVLEMDGAALRMAPEETTARASKYAHGNNIPIALDSAANYSELSALVTYPVRVVKIGEAVLVSVRDERSREALGRYLRAMKGVDIQIVVEGITREDEVNFLAENHLQYAQGPLYGNPVSSNEFLTRLTTLGLSLS